MMERSAFITSIHVGIWEDRIAGRFFKSGAPMLGAGLKKKASYKAPQSLFLIVIWDGKFCPSSLRLSVRVGVVQ